MMIALNYQVSVQITSVKTMVVVYHTALQIRLSIYVIRKTPPAVMVHASLQEVKLDMAFAYLDVMQMIRQVSVAML